MRPFTMSLGVPDAVVLRAAREANVRSLAAAVSSKTAAALARNLLKACENARVAVAVADVEASFGVCCRGGAQEKRRAIES
jgi:hypothetical protein